MFHDHLVKHENQTGNEMMCCSGNLVTVESHLFLMCRPMEGLMNLCKDWTLMLQSCLILLLVLLHEDWFKG